MSEKNLNNFVNSRITVFFLFLHIYVVCILIIHNECLISFITEHRNLGGVKYVGYLIMEYLPIGM